MSNNSAPAFPVDEKHDDGTHYHTSLGLTKLEYFAGLAMQGFCANSAFTETMKDGPDPCAATADCALNCAKALLAKLEKHQ